LQLLRLLQINNGIFIKVTKATSQMLQLVEPYVTYGEPNLKTVRELVLKRGYGKVNKQRIPLTDNAIIEAALGKHGVVSVEDVIHEIMTCGPAFKQVRRRRSSPRLIVQVSAFLWPFKLSNPNGGWRPRKFRHFSASRRSRGRADSASRGWRRWRPRDQHQLARPLECVAVLLGHR